MNENNGDETSLQDAPRAVVKKRKQISIVWLVPLVALAIGGWLAYKAITEKGPTITITFKTAEGLEAGKTKIKYKNVEVGQVEAIEVSDDLSGVVVTAELATGSKPYLTDKTRFWVVRARVAAGEVTALGTAGATTAHFRQGESFELGRVSIASPIYIEIELGFLTPIFGVPVAGICGYDIMARTVVE